MPGATVASEVSCAWPIAAKLDMMPQTVPNRPTNGATEEMTARLGKPPSERIKRSRAARAIASEMRDLSSPTVSPGMRRRASSSPAAATPESDFASGPPARASRTARRMRATEITPSMISTQHHREATNRTAITALPTRLAPRNRPTGERSKPCMPTPRFAPLALYCALVPAFQPHAYSRRGRAGQRSLARRRGFAVSHSLQQAQQRTSGRSLNFLGLDRPVVVRVGALESDFDEGEILILADRLVVVRVSNLPVRRGNAIFQFFAIKGAVMIDIELVEQCACGGLRLSKIDGSILFGVEGIDRRGREGRRSARHDHREWKRDRKQGSKRQGFRSCQLHHHAPGDDHGTQ